MSHHNVKCPKGYGEVAFITITTSDSNAGWCPISGAPNCVSCDIIAVDQPGYERGEIKKKEQQK
jgi:hypothetical protein